MLFCKPVKRRATAKELFKIVDEFVKGKSTKWSDCVGVCTVASRVMAGNKGGLKALIKRSAPEAMRTHCMIHRELLAMKELFGWALEGSSHTSRRKLWTASSCPQHPTCARLDFQQWQPSKQSIVL
jgi:hypothetical protein